MRLLDAGEVRVVAMQRRWRDKNHPELVLVTGRPNYRGEDMWRRDDLPPFVAPPEGTREADEERERANRARVNQQQRQGHLSQNPHQGNPNVNHSGPPSTGKPVEGFVIMLKPHENAVSLQNILDFTENGFDAAAAPLR